MNKILQIKKIFDEKILNNQKNNLYNFSTNLLIDEIKNTIQNIIEEYYFIGIVEFVLLKKKIIKNILLLRNKNYYDNELSYICDDIILLLNTTYYPVYFNVDNFAYTDNNIIKETNVTNKIKKTKFYHKSVSFEVKNNFYDYSYMNVSPNKSEYILLSDSEDENIFIKNQRQIFKNKISLSNFILDTNNNNNKNNNNIKKSIGCKISKTNKNKVNKKKKNIKYCQKKK